ncbi:MAG: hypothetical protein ACI8PZ_001354 [Myxococcota bacterium]
MCDIACGSRPHGGAWSTSILPNLGDNNQDHLWFQFVPNAEPSVNDRVVAHHMEDPGTEVHSIRSRFIDRVGEPSVFMDPVLHLNNKVNWPSNERTTDGLLAQVWREWPVSGTDPSLLRYAKCDLLADDCEDPASWVVSTLHGPARSVQHPEIMSDGALQVIAFSDDPTLGPGEDRVRVMHSCDSGDTWTAPITVFAPALSGHTVGMEYGRPHIVLDRTNQRIHVAVVSSDTAKIEESTTGGVFWVTRPYPACL